MPIPIPLLLSVLVSLRSPYTSPAERDPVGNGDGRSQTKGAG